MGLISPGAENLLYFVELRQVLSTYDGDLRDPHWGRQERPVPMRVTRGPLRIPLPSMPGPKTLCGVGAGTGAFLTSADMDLGVFLESPQWSQSFSRVAAGALDLRRGPQGPALVASGKASPHASYSGASQDSSPVDAGA